MEVEMEEEEQFLEEVPNKEVSEEEEQFLEEVPNKEVSEEEEHNEMEEKEQNEMEEGEQNLMEKEEHDEMEEEELEEADEQHRGAMKIKQIAKDPNERLHVDFTDLGEPCGPGSVMLSSYLGPLVREHVHVVIDNWRKVTEDIIIVLWKSITFKKDALFKKMGCLWRASKSRLVTTIRNAPTMKARMKLRPKNVTPTEWCKFIREKPSSAFKVRKASEIELEGREDYTSTNPKHDMITEILGPDQPGRLKAMGRGISITKLNCLQIKNNFMAAMEKKHVSLEKQVYDLQQQIARTNNQGQETDVSENSNNKV
ncbi:hypothetical protein BRARA_E01808 [Brassica rapa]|uniref:Uncharacterized protein n=1 Tax=Brassica campestris TaxID=3711 RepID=A0A397ZH94_BRACM|nr:hypothetical protein BRARA_E01808 [Brassica rapa]